MRGVNLKEFNASVLGVKQLCPCLHAGVQRFACLRVAASAKAGHAGVSVIRVRNPFIQMSESPSLCLPVGSRNSVSITKESIKNRGSKYGVKDV